MEGSNSDNSDSNDNSVVEAGINNKVRKESQGLPELPEVVRQRYIKKKSQFRGFYLTQKTLVVESNNSSMDFEAVKQAGSLEIDNEEPSMDFEYEEIEEDEDSPNQESHPEVPKIIEDLVKVPEDVEEDEDIVKVDAEIEEDEETEHFEFPINIDDQQKIAKDHESPAIDADFKVSVSQVKHSREVKPEPQLLDVVNTSDEDISELVSDFPAPSPVIKPKSRLKNSGKKIDSPDEDDCIEIKTKKKKAQKKVRIKRESFSSGNETDISDIIVSDMDYYKIRHQSDVKESQEYCLSWSPTRFVTRMSSFDETQVLTIPSIPNIRTCDILDDVEVDDGKDTSDEDFSCLESDFMTMNEFLEAYRTNFEFEKKEETIKMFSTVSIQNDSDSEPDAHNTESLRESLVSDSSSIAEDELDDFDQVTDSEEVETSVTDYPVPLHQQHSPGCIHFMERSDIGGILAFMSPSKTKTREKNIDDNFKPEDIIFESDNDDEDDVISEEICEDEKTNMMEMLDNDDTDEEDISDFADDPITHNKGTDMKMKLEKKTSKQTKKKVDIDFEEKEQTSEDESLEYFVTTPVEDEIKQFPKPSFAQLDGENSSVKSSQSLKVKNKKKRNLNLKNSRKVEMEDF